MTTVTPTARLFKLSPDAWANLEALAAKHQTLAATGPTAGQPSVHALLGAIAAGELVILPTAVYAETIDVLDQYAAVVALLE